MRKALSMLLCAVMVATIFAVAVPMNVSAFGNNAPIADAGPDQSAVVGDTVMLSGSATDPDGDEIVSWTWTIESAPAGSTATMSPGPQPWLPTITPDVDGTYIISLVVNDGMDDSAPSCVTVTVAPNLPPAAAADADVLTGLAPLTVSFDGSSSSDPEGDALTYAWDFGDAAISTDVSPTHEYQNAGTYVATLTVTDAIGQTDTDALEIVVTAPSNNVPVVSPTATPTTGVAPLSVQFAANAEDGDGDALTYSWDFGDSGTSIQENPEHVYQQAGVYTAWLTVSDGQDDVSASVTIVVTTVQQAPIVTITGPASGSLYPVGTPVTFTGTFTDEDTEDTHTAEWTFTSSSSVITIPGTVTESGGSGSVSDAFAFTVQGVYSVSLTVTDNGGLSDTATTMGDLNAMVVIYDPQGGFVTGGGWYWSSAGGYVGDPELEGKVSFGFVAKYHKGADVPKGNTEFRFKAADMDFHSTSYDWLVIAGPRAQFKGTGTINGEGNYAFMLTVIDGDLPGGDGVDKIRMKIWDKGTGIMVYDTNVGTDDNTDPLTPLGGGEIKIHKG